MCGRTASSPRPTCPGAHLIPLGEVVERIDEVPTGQTVYVICARGARSAKAVGHYRAQGIDAVNVAGGTLAWIDAGLPTDRGGRRGRGRVSAHRHRHRHPRLDRHRRRLRRPGGGAGDGRGVRPRHRVPPRAHVPRPPRAAAARLAGRGGGRRPHPGRRGVRSPRVLAGPGLCLMHAASQDLEILVRRVRHAPEPTVRHAGGGGLRRATAASGWPGSCRASWA